MPQTKKQTLKASTAAIYSPAQTLDTHSRIHKLVKLSKIIQDFSYPAHIWASQLRTAIDTTLPNQELTDLLMTRLPSDIFDRAYMRTFSTPENLLMFVISLDPLSVNHNQCAPSIPTPCHYHSIDTKVPVKNVTQMDKMERHNPLPTALHHAEVKILQVHQEYCHPMLLQAIEIVDSAAISEVSNSWEISSTTGNQQILYAPTVIRSNAIPRSLTNSSIHNSVTATQSFMDTSSILVPSIMESEGDETNASNFDVKAEMCSSSTELLQPLIPARHQYKSTLFQLQATQDSATLESLSRLCSNSTLAASSTDNAKPSIKSQQVSPELQQIRWFINPTSEFSRSAEWCQHPNKGDLVHHGISSNQGPSSQQKNRSKVLHIQRIYQWDPGGLNMRTHRGVGVGLRLIPPISTNHYQNSSLSGKNLAVQ
jgi:hypothetical protein